MDTVAKGGLMKAETETAAFFRFNAAIIRSNFDATILQLAEIKVVQSGYLLGPGFLNPIYIRRKYSAENVAMSSEHPTN